MKTEQEDADIYRAGSYYYIDGTTDNYNVDACPQGAIWIMRPGYGHSSNYNQGHDFTCDNFKVQGQSGFVNYGSCVWLATGVDNDVVTECPRGHAVTGVIPGYGHSSNYNEPHWLQCCKMQ